MVSFKVHKGAFLFSILAVVLILEIVNSSHRSSIYAVNSKFCNELGNLTQSTNVLNLLKMTLLDNASFSCLRFGIRFRF